MKVRRQQYQGLLGWTEGVRGWRDLSDECMNGPRKEKRSFAAEKIKVPRVPFGDPDAPTLERRGERGGSLVG